MLAILTFVGGYNLWLSYQGLEEQRVIHGIVGSFARNPVRRSAGSLRYELIIKLKDQPKVFLVPVRFEPAIPDIITQVQPGDSVTLFCAIHSLPSMRESVEIIHLVHKGNVLLDFQKVRAASSRLALICLGGVALNTALLFAAYKKNSIRRFFKSRRFFV
jgi:hypothetical protein